MRRYNTMAVVYMAGTGTPYYDILWLTRIDQWGPVAEPYREEGVTLVAYSPMAQGLLTGKYTPGSLPGGPRVGPAGGLRDYALSPRQHVKYNTH